MYYFFSHVFIISTCSIISVSFPGVSKIKGFYFDVAFFPVDARLEEHSAKGVNEFLHCVKVDHIVPMHMHGLVWRENKVVTKNGESKIWFPEQYGDKVTFEK